MPDNIKNKVVVITGASSGLGEAAARLLAHEGAKLVIGARRLERLKVLSNRMIGVYIKGVLYGIAAVLPHMKAEKSGHIINVSSVAGHDLLSCVAMSLQLG